MQPLKLKAIKQDAENLIPPRIEIRNRAGKYLSTIWADDRISFNRELDFLVEEIEIFSRLSKDFFTLYNSIIEKDEEIEKLKMELNQIDNPIISRQ